MVQKINFDIFAYNYTKNVNIFNFKPLLDAITTDTLLVISLEVAWRITLVSNVFYYTVVLSELFYRSVSPFLCAKVMVLELLQGFY